MKVELNDILIIVGFLLIGVGLWLIYPISIFIYCGFTLMYAGWPKGGGS